MKQVINRLFGLIERKLTARWFNPFATLYLNFRTMPLRVAYRLPIYVYGRVKYYNLNGSIEFNCEVRRGMVKMGRHDDNYTLSPFGELYIDKSSKIIFSGYCSVSAGYIWKVWTGGILHIGNMNSFGSSCTIICSNNVTIGNCNRIAFNSLIMDTNSHYTINLNNFQVKRTEGKVEIGDKNWIGNNSRLNKGCRIGSGCLVGASSTVNKNFLQCKNVLLAGTPAVVKFEGITRCFSYAIEKEISTFFNKHPDTDTMILDENYTDPVEDTIKFFK